MRTLAHWEREFYLWCRQHEPRPVAPRPMPTPSTLEQDEEREAGHYLTRASQFGGTR
jgi:hypothetical protein